MMSLPLLLWSSGREIKSQVSLPLFRFLSPLSPLSCGFKVRLAWSNNAQHTMKPATSIGAGVGGVVIFLFMTLSLTKAWYTSGQIECPPEYITACTSQISCACRQAEGNDVERTLSQQRPGVRPAIGELQVFCLPSRYQGPSVYTILENLCLEFCVCRPDRMEKDLDPSSEPENRDKSGDRKKKGGGSKEQKRRKKWGKYYKSMPNLQTIKEHEMEGVNEGTEDPSAAVCEESCNSFASCKSSSGWDACAGHRLCIPERDSAMNWVGLGKCVSAANLGLGTLSRIGGRDLASLDVECLCNSTFESTECCTAEEGLVYN
jgi:hypothetical protein